MVFLKNIFCNKVFLSLISFSLLEPCFEILLFFIHNFVFQKIAMISFSSVSLVSFFIFMNGFIEIDILSQYFFILAGSFLVAIFVAAFNFFGLATLKRTIGASFFVWLLLTIMIMLKSYALMNWKEAVVFLSYLLSSAYWFLSCISSWMILRLLRFL